MYANSIPASVKIKISTSYGSSKCFSFMQIFVNFEIALKNPEILMKRRCRYSYTLSFI